MTVEERKEQPLHTKIINTIPYILANCTNKAFKHKFEWPDYDPSIGLYFES